MVLFNLTELKLVKNRPNKSKIYQTKKTPAHNRAHNTGS
ncbi:MAG: hypothetical protein ACI9JN_002353 [Bacteroidia bacterium]|jgi:hypothetical protein